MSLKPSTVTFKSLRIGDRFVRSVGEGSPIYTKQTPTSWSDDEGREYHIPTSHVEIRVFEIYYGEHHE